MKKLLMILGVMLMTSTLFAQIQDNPRTESGPLPTLDGSNSWTGVNNYDAAPEVNGESVAVENSDGQFEIVTLQQLTTAWKAGVVGFDTNGMPFAHTAFSNVTVNIGSELMTFFYNDTGVTIAEGRVIAAQAATNGILRGVLFDNSSPAFSASYLGVSTVDGGTPDGEIGLATFYGGATITNHGLTKVGINFGGTNGLLTSTKPLYPAARWGIATVLTDDRVHVQATEFKRRNASKSYSWSSLSSGIAYVGGFYDFSATAFSASQASPSVSYGNASVAYSAHAAIVSSGPGTVDTNGVVGLEVVGTMVDDSGAYVTDSTNIISTNITTLVADTYYETVKYVGTITFQFYIVSGAPATYSLDYNYGYAKYEDVGNIDFTITGLECVGRYGATTTFNVDLLHHKPDGWTYAASNFEPGNGFIASMTNDIPSSSAVNNQPFAWKRTNIDTFIDGNGSEGVLFRLNTDSGNAVDAMDLHLGGVSEEL